MIGCYIVGSENGDDIDIVCVSKHITPDSYRRFIEIIKKYYPNKKICVEYGPLLSPHNKVHIIMISPEIYVAELPLADWIKSNKALWGTYKLNELFTPPKITARKVLWGAYGLEKLVSWLKNRAVTNYRQTIFKNRYTYPVVLSYKKIEYANDPLRMKYLLKYSIKFSIVNISKVVENSLDTLKNLYDEIVNIGKYDRYYLERIRTKAIKEIENNMQKLMKNFNETKPIIKYRRIRESDVEDIATFFNENIHKFKMVPRKKIVEKKEMDLWRYLLRNGYTYGFLAYDVSLSPKKIIGACTVNQIPSKVYNRRKIYRLSIVINPFYINRGVGKELITRTLKDANGMIISDPHINNFPMHRIMKNIGFKNITYLIKKPSYYEKLVKFFENLYGTFDTNIYHLWQLIKY